MIKKVNRMINSVKEINRLTAVLKILSLYYSSMVITSAYKVEEVM